MAGPWEKYQTDSATGPWDNFGSGKNPPSFASKEARAAAQLDADRKLYDPSKGDGTLSIGPFDTGIKTPEWLNRGLSGAGQAVTNVGRGLGQMVGAVDRADVGEARRLDAPLSKTTAGKVGNFAGNVVTLAPLALVPGANTMAGAAAIGAGTGLVQPSESTGETFKNTIAGTVLGPTGLLLGRTLAAGYQGLTGLMRPLTEKGQNQIAAEILQQSATNPAQAAQALKSATELVPGSVPTVAQVAKDPGLAQLERTLVNNPESAPALQRAYEAQRAARENAIGSIAGSPEYRASIKEGRQIFANEDYAKAMSQGFDQDMAAALKPQLDSLLARPSIQSAKMIAQRLAAENDKTLSNFGSIEGLDWLKKALDQQISIASAKPGSALNGLDLKSLLQTKKDFMQTLEQIAPAYKTANDNFAAMSKNINAMDLAAELQSKLYKNAQYGANAEMGNSYQTALANAMEQAKNKAGSLGTAADILPAADVAALENIAKDIGRKQTAQTLGRAVGSPTMQNMMGQNLLTRISGPLGMPQSFAQSVIANTLARPYDFAMKSAAPKISGLLGEAMTDPKKAAGLLEAIKQQSRLSQLAQDSERFLPLPGLLALQGSKQ